MNRYHLDLFSGIGGFALAAQWAGFTTVAFCEIDKYAQEVLKARFGAVMADAECEPESPQNNKRGIHSEKRTEVGTVNLPSSPRLHANIFALDGTQYAGVDLVTGGFPCQPFSCAGKRRGKADDRAIWPEMLRVIKEARPTWILAENVAGIASMAQFDSAPPLERNGSAKGTVGDVFTRTGMGYLYEVLESLVAIGYDVQPLVVPACAVDARHRRDRVWIVGHAAGTQPIRTGESLSGTRRETLGLGCPSQDAADADKQGSQGRHERRECAGERVAGTSGSSDERNRVTIAGLGRVVARLPYRMDSHCVWPEEDPAIPRVSKGVKNRVDRLKGLGNAIVPQVAYQIIQAMIQAEQLSSADEPLH